MSLTCDSRALVDLPKEIIKALPSDLEITELQREQAEYRKVYGSFSRAPPEICKEYEQFHRKIGSL